MRDAKQEYAEWREEWLKRLNESEIVDLTPLFERIAVEVMAIATDFEKMTWKLHPPEALVAGYEFVLNESVESSLKELRLDIEARIENMNQIYIVMINTFNRSEEKDLNIEEINKAVKKVIIFVRDVNEILVDEQWLSVRQLSGEFKYVQNAYITFVKFVRDLFIVINSVNSLDKPPNLTFIEIQEPVK